MFGKKPEKKPVILLRMRDGSITDVITNTAGCAEVIMVNVCTKGSPQTDLQEVKLTMPDGEVMNLLCSITRLNVKHPPTKEDTVIEQFRAVCPEGEYNIDRVEHVAMKRDKATGSIVGDDGTVPVTVGNVVQDFADIYQREFGEQIDPALLHKYKPRGQQ